MAMPFPEVVYAAMTSVVIFLMVVQELGWSLALFWPAGRMKSFTPHLIISYDKLLIGGEE